ncbi:MAG: hypothetical protein IT538_02155, partial [Variibacter sp.]|nr:hypothetical protein [Variibacter sp.]
VVANGSRLRATLGWKPAYDDLPTIVNHALAWERRLVSANARDESGFPLPLRAHRISA